MLPVLIFSKSSYFKKKGNEKKKKNSYDSTYNESIFFDDIHFFVFELVFQIYSICLFVL